MPTTIRVKGEAELQRALLQLRKEVLSELRPTLRKGGEVVRADAKARFSRYDERSAAGYKVRVRQRGVAVEQSLRRTTGLRPDFGALQMREALLPARDAKEGEVRSMVDAMVNGAEVSAGL